MPALSLWTPEDGVLGAVAPLALACAADTALVIDLDPQGPVYPGRSLRALVDDGPTRRELSPPERGVAVLGNGGIDRRSAAEVIHALVAGWPTVVFRLPAWPAPECAGVVPVVPLSPLLRSRPEPAVYQRTVWRMAAPGPGLVLPRPSGSTIRALAAGRSPGPSRWIRAWRAVWELPWD